MITISQNSRLLQFVSDTTDHPLDCAVGAAQILHSGQHVCKSTQARSMSSTL